jgi:riboflavin synthase
LFTGIVENMGRVARVTRRGGGARLEVRSPEVVGDLNIGDSVAVNGACVTVTERNHEAFACDLVPETVARTNLGILQADEEVNLERPMRAGDRFGGHIVQGHVDAVGLVRSRRKVGAQEILEVTIPFELTRYLAPQGSVSVDGVSLTVVAVDKERFRVALIPHTVAHTTLGRKGQGASVNVEVDVLSKYVERHMAARAARPVFGLHEEVPREKSEPEPARAATPQPARPASARAAPAAKQAPKPAPAKPPRPKAAAKRSSGSSRKKTSRPAARTARSPARARTSSTRAQVRAAKPSRAKARARRHR